MTKVRCEIRNPSAGSRGVTGCGVSISLGPRGVLADKEIPEKAVSHLRKNGLQVRVLTPVEETKSEAAPPPAPPKEPEPAPPPAPPAPSAEEPEPTPASSDASEEPQPEVSDPESKSGEEEKSDPPAPEAPAPEADPALKAKLMDLTKKDLVRLATDLEVDASGNKDDLTSRLALSGKSAEELGV